MPVTNFIWDELSDNVLLETDENDVVTASYTNRPEQFGELISQERSGVNKYYSSDGQYSTRDLTDANEKVTDTFIYSAYGEVVERTGPTTNPFGYKGAVGYYTNSETNDIYVRNRTYEPAIGQWLSMDPLGFIDGPNLYQAYFVPGGADPKGTRCGEYEKVDDNPDHEPAPGQLPFADGVVTCVRLNLTFWFVCSSSCPGIKGGFFLLLNTGVLMLKTFTCCGWKNARRKGQRFRGERDRMGMPTNMV